MSPLRYFPTNALLNNNTNSNSNKKTTQGNFSHFKYANVTPSPPQWGALVIACFYRAL